MVSIMAKLAFLYGFSILFLLLLLVIYVFKSYRELRKLNRRLQALKADE